jgi:uncharacterized phiE125 gp8 family phage protein
MKRAIVAPPTLSPAALAELKAWLGISTSRDDTELSRLLGTALELCEGFTGSLPLQANCEELLAPSSDWQDLQTRPVQAITGLDSVGLSGVRVTLAAADYELDLMPDGTGRVRLLRGDLSGRIAVRFTAGLAADWDSLPDAVRHGVIRLAAFQHRARENEAASGMPAAVAALWRPWRRLRLA